MTHKMPHIWVEKPIWGKEAATERPKCIQPEKIKVTFSTQTLVVFDLLKARNQNSSLASAKWLLSWFNFWLGFVGRLVNWCSDSRSDWVNRTVTYTLDLTIFLFRLPPQALVRLRLRPAPDPWIGWSPSRSAVSSWLYWIASHRSSDLITDATITSQTLWNHNCIRTLGGTGSTANTISQSPASPRCLYMLTLGIKQS